MIPTKEDLDEKEKMYMKQQYEMAKAHFERRMFGGWGDPTPSQSKPSTPEQVQPSNDPRNRIFGGNGLHI